MEFFWWTLGLMLAFDAIYFWEAIELTGSEGYEADSNFDDYGSVLTAPEPPEVEETCGCWK